MATKSKVSIILPIRNGADFLHEAINCVLKQTYVDFELLIVNDASSDNTYELCQEFAAKDKRVMVFNNELPLGLPCSLNKGFAKSCGHFLTWTSHDNRMRPNYLKCLLEALESNKSCQLVYSDYSRIDKHGSSMGLVVQPPPDIMPVRSVVGPSFLYTRELYEKIGDYNLEYKYVEDYEYWIRAWLHFSFHKLEKDLYEYRVHDRSLTSTRSSEVKKQKFKLRSDYCTVFNGLKGKKKDLNNVYEYYLNKNGTSFLRAFLSLVRSPRYVFSEMWRNKARVI